jgi:hypothetical protein
MPTTICSVHCGTCKGTERVRLSGIYAETYTLLVRQKQPVTGAFLATVAGCKGPAMANRLVRLERYGLASGERYGRCRRWVALEVKS